MWMLGRVKVYIVIEPKDIDFETRSYWIYDQGLADSV